MDAIMPPHPSPPNMQKKSGNGRQFGVSGGKLLPSSTPALWLRSGFEGGGQEEIKPGDGRTGSLNVTKNKWKGFIFLFLQDES